MEMVIIYTLSDNKGDIRYVGKTKNETKKRLYAHIKECNTDRKSHKINWIKSLLNKGERPIINIVDEVPVNEWQFWEIYWIEQFRQWGFNLTNQTIGGNGGNGYKHSSENKLKMRSSKLGTKLTDEHKKNISDSVKQSYIDNPELRIVEKTIIIDKDLLYQKYITENLSMPKCGEFFNTSEATIYRNLKENNIEKDKSVWVEQMSKNRKVVYQFNLDGSFIKEWGSPIDASDCLNINRSNIASCCRYVARSAGGFLWSYDVDIDLTKYDRKVRVKDTSRYKAVDMYDINSNFIKSYISITEASIDTGVNNSNIQDCCVGRLKSAGNFIWCYKDEKPKIYKNKTLRSVIQYDMNMNYITDYNSLIDAEKATGAKSNCIQMCCVGSYKSSGGFIWKYKE